MMAHDVVRDIVERDSSDADVTIIEGVMGFYDGKSPHYQIKVRLHILAR